MTMMLTITDWNGVIAEMMVAPATMMEVVTIAAVVPAMVDVLGDMMVGDGKNMYIEDNGNTTINTSNDNGE